MEDHAFKEKLDISFDEPGELNNTGWKPYTRNPKVLAGASVGILLALGVGISLLSSRPQTEVYEAESEAQLDKSSIVADAQDSHSNTIFQSTAQLEQFEQQLLSQEAHRYLLEAQSQVTNPDKPCFGQSVHCVFDQFQQDAINQIEHARNRRDAQAMLTALDRVDAVELARKAVMPSEPEVNLSQLAIDNLVQSHKRVRGASAEARAWEVQHSD